MDKCHFFFILLPASIVGIYTSFHCENAAMFNSGKALLCAVIGISIDRFVIRPILSGVSQSQP